MLLVLVFFREKSAAELFKLSLKPTHAGPPPAATEFCFWFICRAEKASKPSSYMNWLTVYAPSSALPVFFLPLLPSGAP